MPGNNLHKSFKIKIATIWYAFGITNALVGMENNRISRSTIRAITDCNCDGRLQSDEYIESKVRALRHDLLFYRAVATAPSPAELQEIEAISPESLMREVKKLDERARDIWPKGAEPLTLEQARSATARLRAILPDLKSAGETTYGGQLAAKAEWLSENAQANAAILGNLGRFVIDGVQACPRKGAAPRR